MQKEQLLLLLEASFPFIGINELKDVPVAVLEMLKPVPPSFLKQLASQPDLFKTLPMGVQRQVFIGRCKE